LGLHGRSGGFGFGLVSLCAGQRARLHLCHSPGAAS
jgi:hypothetical protein